MTSFSSLEHLNSNNSPFKFNAKELDEETGNYYYGARYYDPKFSIWLSVDPLAELMPEWSSYAYTFNNPVNFTDPTGMVPRNPIKEIISKKSTGNLGTFNVNSFHDMTPASNQRWEGSSLEISKTRDVSSKVGAILGVENEFNRSASLKGSATVGVYINDKGEEVNDISKASKLILTMAFYEETIEILDDIVVDSKVNVRESTTTFIFDIVDGENIMYDDSFREEKSYRVDSDKASNSLFILAEQLKNENREMLDLSEKRIEARRLNNQGEAEFLDLIRETNQRMD
ncbi:MAG: RHS repeat domain-containing protein [Bacteroidota bacterium]